MAPADRASWQNPRILSTLLLVFLSGALAGALSMQLGLHDKLHRSGPAWREGNKAIFLTKFKRELNLSPKQADDIATVLDDYATYYQALEGQIDEIRATGKNRILQVLDPGQKQKFEKMMEELQR
jgi:Spy/CpxP family protein refolding chaperone